MNERIAELIDALGVKQYEFAERLGVTETAVSAWKNGRRNITEQTVKAICREYGVDYIWLTTGEGEMFCNTDFEAVGFFDRIMSGENETAKKVLMGLSRLGPDDWRKLQELLDKFMEGYTTSEQDASGSTVTKKETDQK